MWRDVGTTRAVITICVEDNRDPEAASYRGRSRCVPW